MPHGTQDGIDEAQPSRQELLVSRDRTIADTLSDIGEREERLDVWLIPAVALRRAECDALRRKLDLARSTADTSASAQVLELEEALACARFEIAALRQSRSWRVTAPLRWVYRRLVTSRRRD